MVVLLIVLTIVIIIIKNCNGKQQKIGYLLIRIFMTGDQASIIFTYIYFFKKKKRFIFAVIFEVFEVYISDVRVLYV